MKYSSLFAAALFALPALGTASAQSYTWVPTAADNNYDWNVGTNWDPNTGFPNAAGEIANVNNNIVGNQTIRLQQTITVGTLNLGDADGSNNMTISKGTNGMLTFDSGVIGTTAEINLSSVGGSANTISAAVTLNSDLAVDMGTPATTGDAQSISFSGTFDATGRAVTFSGGILGANNGPSRISFSNLIGDENTVITNNSNAAMAASGVLSNFYGTIILNGRARGSNVTTLSTGQSGSVLNAKEIVINGYLTDGDTQMGGAMQTGQGSTSGSNPGQRLTQNTITLNGGYLNAGGQALNSSVVDRVLRDNVNAFNVNSGYNLMNVSGAGSQANANESQRLLAVTTLNRSSGATFFVRSSNLGNAAAANGAVFTIGNSNDFLIGASGAAGGTEMSIIPWMVGSNTNGSAESADNFATYTSDGVRALVGSEYAGSITAGATHNVSTNNVSIAGAGNALTVNSLRYTGDGTSDIGTDNTLTVASGGVIFTGGGSIGEAGLNTTGVLSFGSAEGVVWSNLNNQNGIGAVIAGTGGFTKAGTGTVTMTAANTYSGRTYVSAGTLVVGDGTNASNLGVTGDVGVANGATLTLMNGLAIADTATLTLENFGLYNGMVDIGAGIDEMIGALYLGDTFYNTAGMSFGAVGSGADFESDQWFAGTGMLTIAAVPEPSSLALLGLGLAAALARRRKAS